MKKKNDKQFYFRKTSNSNVFYLSCFKHCYLHAFLKFQIEIVNIISIQIEIKHGEVKRQQPTALCK